MKINFKARFQAFNFSWRRFILLVVSLLAAYFTGLAWQIHAYSSISSPASADAAIVLGAAVWGGKPSPVFEERIKHGINLYQSGRVKYLVFTGGIGKGDVMAESEVARVYAINQGVPPDKIMSERLSHITYENLYEACRMMKAANLQTALIVSDPLHMKRTMAIAGDIGIDALSSPTPTTRYLSWHSKSGSLVYEAFFYSVHIGSKVIGLVGRCST